MFKDMVEPGNREFLRRTLKNPESLKKESKTKMLNSWQVLGVKIGNDER